jgi:5'-AMP-activated protein kinase regulatory beta subunit
MQVERDPNVLAEPNHVMLNHMYAQSIKVRTCNVAVCIRVQDGVMIMSATHRYKKKYVTTLLYKPTAQH